jgi:hypothetical protein
MDALAVTDAGIGQESPVTMGDLEDHQPDAAILMQHFPSPGVASGFRAVHPLASVLLRNDKTVETR